MSDPYIIGLSHLVQELEGLDYLPEIIRERWEDPAPSYWGCDTCDYGSAPDDPRLEIYYRANHGGQDFLSIPIGTMSGSTPFSEIVRKICDYDRD